ncbi:MAG: hypothetical protein WBL61_01675 [Bryobacteraceae bacterium]
MDELRKIILRERGLVSDVRKKRIAITEMAINPVFRRTLKESSWSSATRKAVVSVFETAPPKDGKRPNARRPSVLEMIGSRRVIELTPDPIQQMLNNMADAGYSYSSVKKTRTYVAAALEYAVGERVIPVNPAARVELPGAKLRKPTKRAYGLDEMRQLLSAARAVSLREHLIVRIFYVCGLRPGELFALNDLLFPTEAGTPYRIGNYLKRVLKPIAAKAGIPDMTYRALRRTFATQFQRHGSPKDAQAQLRHSKLEMTGW